MYSKNFTGDEGASTLVFGPRTTTPALVILPAMAPAGMSLQDVQEMYRLAYEWAQAMSRPGGYELANRVVLN